MWLVQMSNYSTVKVTLDIAPFWPKGLSLEQAERDLKDGDTPKQT